MTPRAAALGVGAGYALMTVLELVFGEISIGGAVILDRTTKFNLLHWAVALAMLGSFFAGSSPSRLACRIVGSIFAVVGAWGLLSASSLGTVLGYADGIPVAYTILNLLTGAICLTAGFPRGSRAA